MAYLWCHSVLFFLRNSADQTLDKRQEVADALNIELFIYKIHCTCAPQFVNKLNAVLVCKE